MPPVQTLSTIVSNVTVASNTNADIVRRLYEAFVAGDLEAAATFVATDFVMHVPGTGLNAGEYWGLSGFRKFMSNIARHNGGVFDMDVPVFSVTGVTCVRKISFELSKNDVRILGVGGTFALHFGLSF